MFYWRTCIEINFQHDKWKMQKLDYFIIYDYTDVLQNLYQSSWHFISYVLFIQLLLIYIQKQKHYLDMSCNLVTFSSSLVCINIQIIQWSAFYWLCSRVRLWWIDTFFNNAFVFLTYAKRQISLIYDPLFKSYVHTWIQCDYCYFCCCTWFICIKTECDIYEQE